MDIFPSFAGDFLFVQAHAFEMREAIKRSQEEQRVRIDAIATRLRAGQGGWEGLEGNLLESVAGLRGNQVLFIRLTHACIWICAEERRAGYSTGSACQSGQNTPHYFVMMTTLHTVFLLIARALCSPWLIVPSLFM
jgi:hypothetical protein